MVLTREPGGTALGQEIRSWLLHRQSLAPWTEMLLFMADRTQHLHELIRPALAEGKLVLCDRFIDSTTAYQCAGRGFDPNLIQTLHQHTLQGLVPNLTVLLDVDVSVGLDRARGAAGPDQFERLDLAFHQRVRQAYLTLARQEPQRFAVLSATAQSAAQLHQAALTLLLPQLRQHFSAAESKP